MYGLDLQHLTNCISLLKPLHRISELNLRPNLQLVMVVFFLLFFLFFIVVIFFMAVFFFFFMVVFFYGLFF